MNSELQKGRGAQFNPANRFLPTSYERLHPEAIDEWEEEPQKTTFYEETSKTIVNRVNSPDLGMEYSLNPYQGCEHGCIYCYARNSHQYWGFSAGKDFEQKIIVKKNAPALFKKFMEKKNREVHPVCISGNTDCYQPIERKLRLTRQILALALDYNQPVSMITKNALILRDKDLLKALAEKNLVMVYMSITALDETLRRLMEPRTAAYAKRLQVIGQLSREGVPTGVMNAPIIPGINDQEMPGVLRAAREAGACRAGYTIVRLNGEIGAIFKDWLQKAFPDRAAKVWRHIQNCHAGNVNDSRWGKRMRGTGGMAESVAQQFKIHCTKNGLNLKRVKLDCSRFCIPGGQLKLF